jgi:hypothetical protein
MTADAGWAKMVFTSWELWDEMIRPALEKSLACSSEEVSPSTVILSRTSIPCRAKRAFRSFWFRISRLLFSGSLRSRRIVLGGGQLCGVRPKCL